MRGSNGRRKARRSRAIRLAGLLAGAMTLAGSVGASAQNYYSAGDGLRFGVFGQIAVSALTVQDKTDGTTEHPSNTNTRFGGTFGYDWRFDRTVVGIEADGSLANSSSRTGNYTFANDYYASFRGRLGYYVTPSVLVYGTTGLGLTGFEYKSALGAVVGGSSTSLVTTGVVTKTSSTLAGIVAGFGVEYDLYGMRLFSEYLATAYEKQGFRALGPTAGNSLSVDQTSHQFRLGIKFNLNPEYDVRPYR